MKRDSLTLFVLAALLHDVGKLLERGEIFSEVRTDETALNYLPRREGKITHFHAAHTWAFCVWMEERFACLRSEDRAAWKEWAAAHHRDDERGYEATVIRIADRLSSSEREDGDYYSRGVHRKTLLEPVLQRIALDADTVCLATTHRYPLVALDSSRESCFPLDGSGLGLTMAKDPEAAVENPTTWNHLLASEPKVSEYHALGEGLLNDLESLAKACPEIRLEHLLTSILTLLERYTANVPSATNIRHPDISLFDHMRTTAAIAQGLYVQHFNREKPFEGLQMPNEPKWLMVCGDFSGIQKFIYNLTNKGAAKGLRGRSFYVQMFCRICAEYILRHLSLTKAGLLYNSGGKFYMLVAASQREAILNARKEINAWLLDHFQGDVFFGLGFCPVTADMFAQGHMCEAWKKTAESLDRDRLCKFHEFLSMDFFSPQTNFDPSKSCPVCGSRDMEGQEKECEACENLALIGGWLKDAQAIFTVTGQDMERTAIHLPTSRVVSFSALQTRVYFLSNEELRKLRGLRTNSGTLIVLNHMADKQLANVFLGDYGLERLYLGRWQSGRQVKENGEPWNFDDYAEHARGISRLGILRMDVDNLGLVFIQGLQYPRRGSVKVGRKDKDGWGDVVLGQDGIPLLKPMASISRMATLSRQLNHFFSAYLPTILDDERFDRCQIVYAGGDDLFIIGSWDQLPELAKSVREEFKRFTCNNASFSISGGITLQRGRYPLFKGATLAGETESRGKQIRLAWTGAKNSRHKDGFCFLDVAVPWEDMELVLVMKEMTTKGLNENKGLLGYLSQVSAHNHVLARELQMFKGLSQRESWKSIACYPWRWRTAYQLKRRFSDDRERIEAWSALLFADKSNDRHSLLPTCAWMEMPLRWVDYLHREKGGAQ
jgi:CRISPR-associated protein Csm1